MKCILILILLILLQISGTNGDYACQIVVYQDAEYTGSEYDLTTYTSSASWAGGTDFADNEVTSFKYYCGSSNSCRFRLCEYSYCSSGWSYDYTCSPGKNGEDEFESSQNDQLSWIYASSFVCLCFFVLHCVCLASVGTVCDCL